MTLLQHDLLTPIQATFLSLLAFVPHFIVAALLFAAFYFIATLARRLVRKMLSRARSVPAAAQLLVIRTVYLLTLLIGIIVALSAMNISVGTVFESLGLASIALGFALKDVLENFVAGVLLLFARPFEVGDEITTGQFEGTVLNIHIRSTALKTYDDQLVDIPNAQVLTTPVTNHTRLGKRRFHVDFDTSVSADFELVKRESMEAAFSSSDIVASPAPYVLLQTLQSREDSLSWRLFFWGEPTKATELRAISHVIAELKRRLYDADIPTPTSTSATILLRPSGRERSTGRSEPASSIASDNG